MNVYGFQKVFRALWIIPSVITVFVVIMYFGGNEYICDNLGVFLICLGLVIFTFGLIDLTIQQEKNLSEEELEKKRRMMDESAKHNRIQESFLYVIFFVSIATVCIAMEFILKK